MPGRVDSAFRAFGTQCWVFDGWAHKAHGGFCEATDAERAARAQPAPARAPRSTCSPSSGRTGGRAVFRDGFGCTPGRQVARRQRVALRLRRLPYPIDPDDRKDGSRCATRWDRAVPIDPKTGYKHEPWHVRFVGRRCRGDVPRGVARERAGDAGGDHARAVAPGAARARGRRGAARVRRVPVRRVLDDGGRRGQDAVRRGVAAARRERAIGCAGRASRTSWMRASSRRATGSWSST